jgi:amino acid adenylation domain-containing protein
LGKRNNSDRQFPSFRCIHELFEEQVSQSPDAWAVVHDNQSFTYQELNRRANQLARHLMKCGVGPEVAVGICLEKTFEMVVALLGILKAGGVYVPLDPTLPTKRLLYMLKDTHAPVLLTQQKLTSLCPSYSGTILVLDEQTDLYSLEDPTSPSSNVNPQNLAYIVYTSGTTGQPKGVMVEHQALVNFTQSAQKAFDLDPSDRVLQFAPISFDAAAEEIFPTLVSGGTLYLRTSSMLDTVADFWQACTQWNLTVLNLPTAYWHELTLPLDDQGISVPLSLRLVIIGGEKVNAQSIFNWQQHVQHPVRLLNTYGPTEGTVTATSYEIQSGWSDKTLQDIPIGRPLPNVNIFILDRHLHPAPFGVPGELYIGGPGVARGYLNQPDRTAEKFLPNPFSSECGFRLFKTGDLVRFREGRVIEYLGRLDDQVKIRGFRVELGEIGSVLLEHPGICEAKVLLCEVPQRGECLVAYVIPTVDPGPSVMDLRRFVRKRLPGYMHPVVYVKLGTWPLIENGKIDVRALPSPEGLLSEEIETFVAPRGPVEQILADMWMDILGQKQIGVHDNFFNLGGHSLLATQVISRLRNIFRCELSIRTLFESPTIAELSRRIESESRLDTRDNEIPIIQPIARQDWLPLSFSQERMWFLHQLSPESTAYNLPATLRLRGPLNHQILQQSLEVVIRRHESLRTTFVEVDGQLTSKISSEVSHTIQCVDLRTLSPDHRLDEIGRAHV